MLLLPFKQAVYLSSLIPPALDKPQLRRLSVPSQPLLPADLGSNCCFLFLQLSTGRSAGTLPSGRCDNGPGNTWQVPATDPGAGRGHRAPVRTVTLPAPRPPLQWFQVCLFARLVPCSPRKSTARALRRLWTFVGFVRRPPRHDLHPTPLPAFSLPRLQTSCASDKGDPPSLAGQPPP